MKYGPISAAISAMIKAIASPSSVVCTVSPLEQVPARWPCAAYDAVYPPGCACHRDGNPKHRAAAALCNQRRNNALYRVICGEVTTTSCDGFTREAPSPARGQPLEAAQDKGRPPFRVNGVIQPQIRQATQQGCD